MITDIVQNAVKGISGIDVDTLCAKITAGAPASFTHEQLAELAAETAASLVSTDPVYSILAAHIAIDACHRMTPNSFSDCVYALHAAGVVSNSLVDVTREYAQELDKAIVHERDYAFDYFGFKTLERGYLTRVNGALVERPQYMFMRVALGIHGNDIVAALQTYHYMSQGYFTHATPTLFNAGTLRPQMSSCFLVDMKDDSIEGIYDTLKECALISKSAGGIGLAIHKVRGTGAKIHTSNGTSTGIVPMLRVFNETARYVDQGGGKRRGAIAAYLEPWHPDVFHFLDLRKNQGKEEQRARDMFFALWIPDLFMCRVEAGEQWTLFDPNTAPGLQDVWGDEFVSLYTKYENEGRGVRTVKAQDLWWAILDAQVETGTPFMCYKDACNRKSNHQHLGTIKSSNLCTEIVQYTDPEETAVCNLASVALPRFVIGPGADTRGKLLGSLRSNERAFDFDKLRSVVRVITHNLNRVIDVNYYPTETARRSNLRHRPIGIGVQGLSDVFTLLGMPFDSPEATRLNREIFECIYYSALNASCELAVRDGPYETYAGSPASRGILQPDMWGVGTSDRWDWAELRQHIADYGLCNSLLVAPMPTASTSQILGNNEAFEPYTSNIYVRRVLSGEFVVVNQHLAQDLKELGLWTRPIVNKLIADNGSVQDLPIPLMLKEIYKTVWEIKQRVLVDMAADRGAFIDQSQSFNVFMAEPTFDKLTSLHFYGWMRGLKTGMYYLRTRPARDAIKFTVDKDILGQVCTKEQGCVVCSS